MTGKIDFPKWLQKQMDDRGWGQADLANRAGINRQVIWGWLNRRKKPNEDILKKIAKAFNISIEEIYQAAGMLPPEAEPDLLTKAIMYFVHDLDNEEKNEVLEYVKLRRRLSRQSKDDN